MRRDDLLRGLGALAAAEALSACGSARGVRDRLRGCGDAAVPRAGDDVTTIGAEFHTSHVRGPVRFAFAVPSSLEASAVRTVAYVLPGRGATADSVFEGLGFSGFFADLVRAKHPSMMLAAIDAGETYFHGRASGEDRLAAVTVDLGRAVRGETGHTMREALIGQSMGGFGALLAAVREPRRYRSVAVAGPALFTSYADERRSVGDAFDDAADFARNDVIAHAARLRGVPVLVRCGDQDPFAPAVRAFAARCPTADVKIVPGCHTDGFWRATAAELLRFTAAHL